MVGAGGRIECPNTDKIRTMSPRVNPHTGIDKYALLQATLFGKLGTALLDEVVACARVERFDTPSLLAAAGQPLQCLRLVVRGNIAIVARRSSGKEVTISDIGPGAWATWLPCFMPAPLEHDFVCGPHSCFIALPVVAVQGFCAAYPQLYPLVIGEIGQRLRLLMEWTSQSALIGPEQRMAKLIGILARDQQIKGNQGTLHIHQTRLATLARCSRQSANALLKRLEKRGLVKVAYGKLEIPDRQLLAAFADQE